MKPRLKPPAPDIVVAGYLGIDLIPGFPPGRKPIPAHVLFQPGKLVETEGLRLALGGVVANTGLALKRFGRQVEFMGCIGCDALGDMIANQFSIQGVARGLRRTRRAGTAYGIVLSPPGVDRIFFEDPGCNRYFIARHIDYRIVAQSRLFHFGYPPLMQSLWQNDGAELRTLFQRVRQLGVTTSLDMALPDPDSPAGRADWRAILANVLPHVDIFVPSIEELLFMMEPALYTRILRRFQGGEMIDAIPESAFARLADRILESGVRILMIKAGHRGAYLRTGDVTALTVRLPAANWNHRSRWIPSYRVDRRKIRNACGAGDCAVAGFLSALLDGAEIEPAARYAMLAGRDNLYGDDAISGLRDWKTMTNVLARRTVRR